MIFIFRAEPFVISMGIGIFANFSAILANKLFFIHNIIYLPFSVMQLTKQSIVSTSSTTPEYKKLVPATGVEPATHRLRVCYASSCAKQALKEFAPNRDKALDHQFSCKASLQDIAH